MLITPGSHAPHCKRRKLKFVVMVTSVLKGNALSVEYRN